MADKFDSFSKHLATRQTRRGALKFLGAGVIGAALTAVFARDTNAGSRRNPRNPRTGTNWRRHDDKIVLNETTSVQ